MPRISQKMLSKLICVILLLPHIISGQFDECDFSEAAVQRVFDKFEEIRKSHAFDPTNSKVAVTKFSQYKSWKGDNAADLRIPPFFIADDTKEENGNKHLSMNGFSTLENNLHVNFERRPEGYAFFKPGQEPMFTVPIQDLDVELPSSARGQLSHEHLEIFDKIIGLRKKLYAFKEKVENANLQITLYDVNSLRNGYFAQFHGFGLPGGIAHSAYNTGEYDGRYSCSGMDQIYNVVNGKVELKGVPYHPVYH